MTAYGRVANSSHLYYNVKVWKDVFRRVNCSRWEDEG